MLFRSLLRPCLLVLALAAPPAVRADTAPPPDAILDLDTGGHRATIRALAVGPDGRVWSAGDDKVIRGWDLAAGATVAQLRGEAGPGAEGTVNALALSADGSRLAAGGYFAPHLSADGPFGDVRIFDTGTGEILRVLRGHDLVVGALAYSAARDELLVSGQGGIVQRWQAPFGDAEPRRGDDLDSQSNRVTALAYAAGDSRIVAATFDYGLKLWDAATGAEIEVPDAEPLWDSPVVALSVAPDGSRFALATEDGRVELRDALTGTLLQALPQAAFRPDALVLTADRLVVSCGYRCGTLHRSTVWDLAKPTPAARDLGPEGVHAARLLPSGEVLLAGGRENRLVRLDPVAGTVTEGIGGLGAPVSAVAISADGSRIAWGRADPCPDRPACPEVMGPLDTAMTLPTGDRAIEAPRATPPDPDLLRALLGAGGYGLVATALGGFEAAELQVIGPTRAKLRKGATDGFYFSSYGLVPERQELIAGGGNGVLLAHSLADGRVTGEFTGHTGDVLALAVAPAANRLLTGSADQTLRLWTLDTRRLVVSIFVAGEDWIIWTPEGYFQSSPDGDRLVGWQVNQGPDRAARYIRARQLRQHLYSPEIVRRAILTGDSAAAATELRGTDSQLQDLLSRPAPDFTLRVADEISAPEGFATIEIAGVSLEEMTDWGFSVLVNDRRVIAQPVPDPDTPVGAVPDPRRKARFLYQVPLDEGENAILVSGEDDFGYITERSGAAIGKFSKPPEATGRLFVAVIGINAYPELADCGGKSCDLAFPVADALGFLKTVQTHSAPLFSGIETLVIATPAALAGVEGVDPATVLAPDGDTITDALIDFLSKPGPDDTTMIFVASHGINIDERFYLIPEDGQKRGDDFRKSSLVDWSVIQDEIGFAEGRRILLLDTCHAANAFNAKLEKEAADARVIVFSATAANNTAQERRDLGHGIFTWSVIQGLSGAAGQDGGVRLLGLADYIYREVVRLSDGKQEPFYHISQTANFLLARS